MYRLTRHADACVRLIQLNLWSRPSGALQFAPSKELKQARLAPQARTAREVQAIHTKFCRVIYSTNLPFSAARNEQLVSFMDLVCPGVKMPAPRCVGGPLLEAEFKMQRSLLKELLSGEYCTLSIDGWSGPSCAPVIGMCVADHVLTAMETHGQAHTAQQMATWTNMGIQMASTELACTISGIVGDNASNMNSARSLLPTGLFPAYCICKIIIYLYRYQFPVCIWLSSAYTSSCMPRLDEGQRERKKYARNSGGAEGGEEYPQSQFIHDPERAREGKAPSRHPVGDNACKSAVLQLQVSILGAGLNFYHCHVIFHPLLTGKRYEPGTCGSNKEDTRKCYDQSGSSGPHQNAYERDFCTGAYGEQVYNNWYVRGSVAGAPGEDSPFVSHV